MRFVTENPEAFRDQLLEAKKTILSRLKAIENDKTRKGGPLDTDSEERATQLQNKDVIDQLDRSERHELEKINAALERIKRGEFGKCLSCGKDIEEKRLKAMPTATQCMECVLGNH